MYSILEHYLSTNHILMIGMIVTFILSINNTINTIKFKLSNLFILFHP